MTHAEILARQEEMRRAGTLPGAKGTGTRAPVQSERARPKRVPLVCVHLGAPVNGTCKNLVRACALHNCTTAPHTKCDQAERHCPTCPDFAPPPEVPT